MNKKGLIEQVSKSSGLSYVKAWDSIDCCIDCIKTTLKKGKKVRIAGFGTFKPVKRKPREGRNPKTGDKVPIPMQKSVKFVSGKTMKTLFKG